MSPSIILICLGRFIFKEVVVRSMCSLLLGCFLQMECLSWTLVVVFFLMWEVVGMVDWLGTVWVFLFTIILVRLKFQTLLRLRFVQCLWGRELKRLGGYNAFIEGDSFSAIQWGSGLATCPWRLVDWLRRFSSFLLSWIASLFMSCKAREGSA